MNRSTGTLALGSLMLSLAVIAVGATGHASHAAPFAASSSYLDCEGNACAQVTLTYDEAKEQYKVRNNSDRSVRVEASDWAGGSSVRVEGGKTDHLPMKSFVGAYRANYE